MKTLTKAAIALSIMTTAGMSYEVEAAGKITAVAHRGASGYAPENTISAFDQAVRMHADYFELDVQVTKGGQLVVMHDNTVDRTTDGTGLIGTKTLAEMKQLDAGSWFNPSFTGERVPTFDQVLKRYKGNRTGILIELKSPELYPGVEQKVADSLKKYHLDKMHNNKIIIQSFNHESVRKSKMLLPAIKHGVLIYGNSTQTTAADMAMFKTYADYYNPDKKLVNKTLVQTVHAAGMKIFPYTVRKQEEVAPLVTSGVDGIITDYPDMIMNSKVKVK